MTIRIVGMHTQPGLTQNVSFSDNFNRANSSQPGNDWIVSRSTGGASDSAQITTNRLVLTHGSTVSGSLVVLCDRVSGLFNRSQFAQGTFITSNSTAGTTIRGGIAVAYQGDPNFTQRGYVVDINPETLVYGVFSFTAGTIIGLIPFVFGDTFRLNVEIQPSQNVITVLRNGVIEGSTTDNNATRPQVGTPGFRIFTNAGATRQMTWDDFSCGLL